MDSRTGKVHMKENGVITKVPFMDIMEVNYPRTNQNNIEKEILRGSPLLYLCLIITIHSAVIVPRH